tara:strand:+ start:262 stop:3195 length:2934 start_codon:yes stop_codon:yes gene_type:complete
MIRDYIEGEQKYINKFGEKTMFLMQCGSFYEVYCCKKNNEFTSNRITEFARICDMRIANKKSKYKGLNVFMCGFPELHLEKYVTKLNDAGWTVAVHSQDPTCPTIRSESGIFSPGTNFESTTTESNRIMTVWLEVYNEIKINKNPKISCGIASVDIISGDVHCFQCVENFFNNPTTFDELERFNSSYRPNEVVIIYNCSDKEIDEIINYANLNSKLIHKINTNDPSDWRDSIINCQKQTYQEKELTKYYNIQDFDVFYDKYELREKEYSTQSLIFLLNFLEFHNHNLVKQLKEPNYTNFKERVRLANHSLRQLNIIDNHKKNKYSSLISLVNKCKTSMGKRYLSEKLLNPTNDIDYLNKEYNIQEYVITSNKEWENHYKSLEKITDFERLFRKIILNKIAPSDISILYDNLKIIENIYKNISKDKSLHNYLSYEHLSKYLKILKKKISDFINITIAGTISAYDFDTNIFKEGIYNDLDNAEFEYLNYQGQLERIRQFLISKLNDTKSKDSVRIHQTEKSGLFLIVTKTRFNKLVKILKEESLQNKNKYKLKYTIKDKELNINFDLKNDPLKQGTAGGNNVRLDSSLFNNIYNKISQTKSNLREILMNKYRKYIESFLENKNEFETIINYVTKLDFLLTRCFISTKFNYCKPTIKKYKQSFIDAKDIRHPLIEHINENELYVTNNVSLGLEHSHTGIMLFGTNAVGKSSLIRSIGMTVILAQAGFFVPCSEFTYNPYNAIFTRILGNDDIFKGLSTFAVEMSELSCILNNADENSLILGDELCSGTETSSALCIFSAGVIMLHNRNTSFIFATHFHELIEYEQIKKLNRLSLQHMVVRYDEKLKMLVYDRKIKQGSGNKLYGLEVCKSLSMPRDFLTLANRLRCENISTQNLILHQKTSSYNSKKIKDKCEFCGEKATEIHHMQPQEDADEKGFIGSFHKNHKANLCSICNKCHKKITKNNTKHIRVKTEIGMTLVEK